MSCSEPDPRLARLYELLPAIYRIRDVEQGEPLKALLSVIAEQVNIVEDDIARLYDDWFIETAQDWVVPYLGDLIGYTPVQRAGNPAHRSPSIDRILVPRRDVAHTIRARRCKGTLALLEELARDTAGYPARAVEFFRMLAYFQNLNMLRPARGRSVDVRSVEVLERLDGPFDELAHTVDVRKVQSQRSPGRYNIPSVGVFVWRLRSYSVTAAPAACIEEVGPGSYTFSVLGNDNPLFTRVQAETDPTSIADEPNLPVPIRCRALEKRKNLEAHYGEKRSFFVWKGSKKLNKIVREPLDGRKLIVADLSDWKYLPRKGTVALDPALGRLVFPPGELPAGIWVSYQYGFSADIGGGEYDRTLRPADPAGATDVFYSQISHKGKVTRVEDALEAWKAVRTEKPRAVLEITDSEVYAEQLNIVLHKGESLQIRAANNSRPVIYLLDRERNLPDSLTVTTEGGEEKEGGCFTIDGLLVAGRPIHVEGALQQVTIRHSTLVPGWDLAVNCEPKRPAEPSLELYRTNAQVRIERSILGSIQVYQDEVTSDPTPISIEDSILDATGFEREAVGAPNWPLAHAVLNLRDCTVFGQVQTHAIALAENSIFMGTVRVARRQVGCMRFCYVPPVSRTPRRYRCQPDLVEAPIRSRPGWKDLSQAEKEAALSGERLRVRPQFDRTRYGPATYARLARVCAVEIKQGADDESEMGAFHDLFEPQRLANLRARVEEYTPARTDAGIILAD